MTQCKSSKYLREKVENFSNTLSFFMDSNHGHKLTEKRLVFLAQIDFWEWEMETLIYSFSNFKERSKAWVGDIESMVRKHGILVKTKCVEKTLWDRGWPNNTVAPVKELNDCIDKWNQLLETCEQTVMVDRNLIDTFNADFLPNLNKFRKERFVDE